MTAAPWPLSDAASAARAYLALRSLDSTFALPIGCARSVFKIEALTRVPLAPPCFLGLVNLRGQIVAAVCLARRLDPNARLSCIGALAVVLEVGVEVFALAVQEIGDVVYARDDELIPMPIHVDVRKAAPMSGVLRAGSALVPILDPPSLFDFHHSAEAA